eukprot:CAMPEP_0196744550 /NCGR_PEP_ID=MMETSP1091-20130531/58021_1 /TAXON_ID=302021 /ORGANISM="Rhodomonas sp., Strain CCMP768" /LENGTH=30 /DNA_ID= /DNA_START= /DNA_END= /DNA_ORIENTATION=
MPKLYGAADRDEIRRVDSVRSSYQTSSVKI